MTVEISVVVGQKGELVVATADIQMSGIVESHESFLFQSFADVLDWIFSPNLPFLHDSAWWNHAVWRYDSPLLNNRTFHDDRIMADIGSALESTRVQGAVILDHIVSLEYQLSCQS